MVDEDKIVKIAQASTFFVQNGLWLRIDYVDVENGNIYVHNEETGEEYDVEPVEVNFDTDKFYRLTAVDPDKEIEE